MTKMKEPKIVTNVITGEKYDNKTGRPIDPIKRLKIFKITLEIELKEEFQKTLIEDIYNLIKDDIDKYAFSWKNPSTYLKMTISGFIKSFTIHKISLEIELKEEFQKSSIQDIYNLIKDDINKYAFKWSIPSAHIK